MIGNRRALVVVDYQNDFVTGSLPVPGAGMIGTTIRYDVHQSLSIGVEVVMTRCWHPIDHCSFVPQGGPWPVHCVQWTHGAEYALPDVAMLPQIHHISKGRDPKAEQYGARDAGLTDYLLSRNVGRVSLCGVATEFCVMETALQLRADGFFVGLIRNGIAGLDGAEAAIAKMRNKGIVMLGSLGRGVAA